jgi:asparagine synthase (glutamine-hydrolysing)
MCGIVGILVADRADPQRLAAVERMAATLRHRGPDDSGFWFDHEAGIALGHRRLAIVDLSAAGRQPMLSHDRNLVLTFNGEIYNFAEFRPRLEDFGHVFRGHSDSEVMLAALESFGLESALQKCAGMFAMGIWDRNNRCLHLVRDRMGKKPLYVAVAGGALIFASELKAILAFPGFQPVVDRAALDCVLGFGWMPDWHCIWKGVFKLPPGSVLSLRSDQLNGATVEELRSRVRFWWSLAEVAESGQRHRTSLDIADLEAELDDLLRTAVGQRMVADVPLGAFLSGGIDSSAVVAAMQAQSSRPIRTFTIGFREAEHDEAAHASRVAGYLGTEHVAFRVTPQDALAAIPDLPVTWDEPFADESQVPTLLLARLARQHVTVALSGDGGDECFGGYARHFASPQLSLMLHLPLLSRRLAAAGVDALSRGTVQACLSALRWPMTLRKWLNGETLQKYTRLLGAVGERDLYDRLVSVAASPVISDTTIIPPGATPPLPDVLGRLIYLDMACYLPGDVLVKLDRATMAASLEARCPFLDHRMVEFAWRLPSSVKVRDGCGKWLLRRVLRRYLPSRLFERPKQGFNVPIGAWLKGPLREWAQDLLDGGRMRHEGLLDPERASKCWAEHLSGRSDRARELWAILMVAAWLEAMRASNLQLHSRNAVQPMGFPTTGVGQSVGVAYG